MTSPLPDSLLDEVHDLTLVCLSGEADPEDVERLNELLLNNEAVRRIYTHVIRDSFSLRRWAAAEELHTGEIFNEGDSDTEFLRLAISDADMIAATPFGSISGDGLRDTGPGIAPPAPGFLGSAYHGTVGFFSQEVPLACLITTVIMGMMLLGAWAYKITHHQHIAEAPSQSAPSDVRQEMVFVGRITGMVDVKWSDDSHYSPPPGYAHVPLGRKYKLDAGLMEITYDSGAKVILQGPCTYEVESTAGGYLSLGKLTARVGEKGEGRGEREEKGSRFKVQGSSSKPEPSSFILHPSSLFFVRTPTAIVTDLGTEFGVEVSEEGATESRVFRGSVRVEVVMPEKGQVVVLRENESARVEGRGKPRITMLGTSAKTADFTRRIPKVTYKTLDLVDVVAGGDGFSGRRNRGIDPTSGRIVDTLSARSDAVPSPGMMTSDGQYHRVEGMPLIDGVFIPDCGKDAVQVDSAGHVFAGFSDTTNANATFRHIWAGGAFRDGAHPWKLIGANYSSPGHGLVIMYANNAITFDLEAIRRANPGSRLLRFHATAVNAGAEPDYESRADVWVLVDGQSRFQSRLLHSDYAVSVLVAIHKKDRFLTLASTDGGNGIGRDWIFFGDPRLHLMLVEADKPNTKENQSMER